MKRTRFIPILAVLLALQIGCGGGGGGDSSTGNATTTVRIVLGESKSASPETYLPLRETSSIPASVYQIRFTISASDMETIQRVVTLASQTTLTESFEVPIGPNRRFLVEALDSGGYLIFQGDVYADVGSVPLSLTINTVNTDPVSPVFSGLSSITNVSSTSLVLAWSPASDNVSAQEKIQYLIYVSTSAGGQNFATPTFTSTAGAISYSVTQLSPSTSYYFVVRAKDEKGNTDGNTVERSTTTAAAPDATAPVFAGLGSVTWIATGTLRLSWSAATDDVTSQSQIQYLIYMATSTGGQNFSSPTFTTNPGATSYDVANLIYGQRYYFVVRARDEAGNVDSNTVENSALVLGQVVDLLPPVFAGLEDIGLLENGTLRLFWSPATDDVTAQDQIRYLIYIATSKGGQNFSSPSFTSEAGATVFDVTGLSLQETYCLVVRARDESGNIDANAAEICLDRKAPDFKGLEQVEFWSENGALRLFWSPATDDITPQDRIEYLIYVAGAPGYEDFSSPDFTSNPGATFYDVTGLGGDQIYYFIVRAKDEAGNIDANIVEIPW